MIPQFKLKDRPTTDISYQQVTHVDGYGRTVMEFVPQDAMKQAVTPVDRFLGVDVAEAQVQAPGGQPATAQLQIRFPIPAKNIRQAWELFDQEAQKELDKQLIKIRQQALAHPGGLPPGTAGR